MRDGVSTGVGVLDRRLGGGLPRGSVVVLSADPASQSEQLLYEMTAARPTLFLTTVRSEQAVEDAMRQSNAATEDAVVVKVDETAPLDDVDRLSDPFPRAANLVVDAADVLERAGGRRFPRFVTRLRDRIADAGGLVFLHCLSGRQVPDQRDVTEYVADVVFDLSTEVRGDRVETRLVVPKFRGGEPFEESVKLEISREVAVDTSRDIA